MKTHTVLITPEDEIVKVCNSFEDEGWAVRQIALNPAYGLTYIVFETDAPSRTKVPSIVPFATYKSSAGAVRTPSVNA